MGDQYLVLWWNEGDMGLMSCALVSRKEGRGCMPLDEVCFAMVGRIICGLGLRLFR